MKLTCGALRLRNLKTSKEIEPHILALTCLLTKWFCMAYCWTNIRRKSLFADDLQIVLFNRWNCSKYLYPIERRNSFSQGSAVLLRTSNTKWWQYRRHRTLIWFHSITLHIARTGFLHTTAHLNPSAQLADHISIAKSPRWMCQLAQPKPPSVKQH